MLKIEYGNKSKLLFVLEVLQFILSINYDKYRVLAKLLGQELLILQSARFIAII